MKIRSIQALLAPVLHENTDQLATSYRDMSLAFAKSDQSLRDLGLTPYNMGDYSADELEPGEYTAGKKEVLLYFGRTPQDAVNGSQHAVELKTDCVLERDCRQGPDGKYTLTKISGNANRYLFFTLRDMDGVPEVGKGHAYLLGRLDNNGFAPAKLDASYRFVYFAMVKKYTNHL